MKLPGGADAAELGKLLPPQPRLAAALQARAHACLGRRRRLPPGAQKGAEFVAVVGRKKHGGIYTSINAQLIPG